MTDTKHTPTPCNSMSAMDINPSHYALAWGYNFEVSKTPAPTPEQRIRYNWSQREDTHFAEGRRLGKLEKKAATA